MRFLMIYGWICIYNFGRYAVVADTRYSIHIIQYVVVVVGY